MIWRLYIMFNSNSVISGRWKTDCEVSAQRITLKVLKESRLQQDSILRPYDPKSEDKPLGVKDTLRLKSNQHDQECRNEPPHDKTNEMISAPMKTQISLGSIGS